MPLTILSPSPDFPTEKPMTEAFIQRGSSLRQPRILEHALHGRPGAQPRPFRSIGVVGAGRLGSAVTASLLDAGIPVTLKECSANRLDEGLARLETYLRDQVKAGMLTPEEMDSRMELLTPTCWYVALSSVDIVIDCADEKPDERVHAIASLDRVMRPGAILAANAGSPDIEALARHVRRPCDLVGVRFANAAHAMRFMEIAKCERTAEDVVATLVTLAAAMNRIPVVGSVS